MDEMHRETLTKFHQPDRRLAEVQDREAKAGSERERREIRRDYYRSVRAEAEASGTGRQYADRRDMTNNGRRDGGPVQLGPTVEAHTEARAAAARSTPKRGRSWAIGWIPKRDR